MEMMSAGRHEADEDRFPVGSWERPDPAGIVRRGEAVGFRGYVERYGEPPVCFVGEHGERGGSMAPAACERPAAVEVYGLWMCAVHGEEAAFGALEEIAHDLEQELQRPVNPYVRSLSPHLAHALGRGFEVLPEGVEDYGNDDAALLAAFPLDRGRACAETLAYVEDPDGQGRGTHEPPFDAYMRDRMLLHRHMRLAFEEGADWLVEMLEAEREQIAAQVAYALALGREAGLR